MDERCSIVLSDAIRIFLQQVVRRGGLPFAVGDPGVRAVPGKQLRAMKRASQARDRALVQRGDVLTLSCRRRKAFL